MHCGIGFLYLLPFSLLKKPKKEANRIKKTVKFATTPSPPSSEAAASPFSGLETNDTGTNTMGVDDGEDDYEGTEFSRMIPYIFLFVGSPRTNSLEPSLTAITVAPAGFPLLAPKIVEAREV